MPTNSKKKAPLKKSESFIKRKIRSIKASIYESRETSPHQSFRMSRRRDYVRTLPLPNPILFIIEVSSLLWVQRRTFLPLMIFYALLYAALVGIASQDTYSQLVTTLEEAGSDVVTESGSALEQAGLTLLSIVSGNISGGITETQQIFGALLALLAWLTTVWLLRNILAGNKVKVRDGLYNAAAPLVSTAIIVFVIIIQLLPVALAVIGYAAASSSGLIANGGIEAMLFWLAAGLLGLLSVFWISTSLFAAIIVTLPGMYPLEALRTSRDLLLGRRLKLFIRVLWMLLFLVTVWVVLMIPIILFDGWLKWAIPAIGWLPIVPVVILILSTYSIFWGATYTYVLYRKVIDNEPA